MPLSPEGYADELDTTIEEGYLVFAQKFGHEVGHAYDDLNYTAPIGVRVDQALTKALSFGKNDSPKMITRSFETEARQKYFNGIFYSRIGEQQLSSEYFAISEGLSGSGNTDILERQNER